MEALTSKSCA